MPLRSATTFTLLPFCVNLIVPLVLPIAGCVLAAPAGAILATAITSFDFELFALLLLSLSLSLLHGIDSHAVSMAKASTGTRYLASFIGVSRGLRFVGKSRWL